MFVVRCLLAVVYCLLFEVCCPLFVDVCRCVLFLPAVSLFAVRCVLLFGAGFGSLCVASRCSLFVD